MIIYTGDDKPCTANGVNDIMETLQLKDKHRRIVIDFCPIVDPIRRNYQNYCVFLFNDYPTSHIYGYAFISSKGIQHNLGMP